EATKAGISIGISDMIIPKEKQTELENAYKQIRQVEQQYRRGIITDGERYNKGIDIWTHAGDEISSGLFRTLEHNEGRKELNPVYLMVDSGARGNRQQVRQLAGMRGLMAKPSGEIIERPITSNFREGLSVLEYFISTHGARKGLADTALKTADSGYLTRRLVDVAQDVIISDTDCGTLDGIEARAIVDSGGEIVERLSDRIIGRVALEPIADPASRVAEQSTLETRHRGTVRFEGLMAVEGRDTAAGAKSLIVMNRSGSINIVDDKGVVRERYSVVYGARLKVKDGQHVEKGQIL